MLFFIRGIIKRYIIYSFFGAIIASFFLAIVRDSDASFNCPARIKTFSIIFPASIFSSVRAIDRFFAALSASAKSLF